MAVAEMTGHPNRGAGRAGGNPSPEQIREFRRASGLSAAQAGALVHTVGRVWQQWESGERRMHPAFWELARIKAPANFGAEPDRRPDEDGGY
jgi:hypothetical protein